MNTETGHSVARIERRSVPVQGLAGPGPHTRQQADNLKPHDAHRAADVATDFFLAPTSPRRS